MKRSLGVFAVLIALGLARPVAAQVQTGSILVRAADQQGAMTFIANSPVLSDQLKQRLLTPVAQPAK